MPPQDRPKIDDVRSGAELGRWYWTKEELASKAALLGISRSGSKGELTLRVVAALDGRPVSRGSRRVSTAQLRDPVTAESVIPPGQRCSQALRRFFVAQIGASFNFDQAMRDFIAAGAGRTLGQAVEHWYSTRTAEVRPIGAQFQYNQFVRDWHSAHPDGSHAEAVAAWKHHRSQPIGAAVTRPESHKLPEGD